MDTLTRKVTAFDSWEAFSAAMDRGYVPTLRPQSGKGKAVREYNDSLEQLAGQLESLGYRIWRGSR